nr:hypothetical protein [Tanacetum cinerariifolium]
MMLLGFPLRPAAKKDEDGGKKTFTFLVPKEQLKSKVIPGGGNSYVGALKRGNRVEAKDTKSEPSIVLGDECVNDKNLSNALLGRVKEFASLANLKLALGNEGFGDITIKYMGELWVLLEFKSEESKNKFKDNVEVEGVPFKLWSGNTFSRIANKWGKLLDVDDQEETANETPGWVPDFKEEADDEDEANSMEREGDGQKFGGMDENSDDEEVPDTMFEDDELVSDDSWKYPPGYTPFDGTNEKTDYDRVQKCEDLKTGPSTPPSYSSGPSTPPSYSSGPSTPPSYSSGPSTPPNYSSGYSRNAKCSNCKHLRGKISVLKSLLEQWRKTYVNVDCDLYDNDIIEMGFLIAKGRGSGNYVKGKGLSMDDGRDVGNGVKGDTSQKTVNFRPLFTSASNGVDVHIPKESICISSSLVLRMEAMLKSGPWLIHNVPLILKQWTPDANVMKEDVWNITIWVKFSDVPIIAFIKNRLSAIASKLDSPLMLDSYTTAMCTDSWGRAIYDRAMIGLKIDVDLRDTIVVAVPKCSREGFTTSTIRDIYE